MMMFLGHLLSNDISARLLVDGVVIFALQPENILLTESLNIKLADFGIAAFISHDEELKGRMTDMMNTLSIYKERIIIPTYLL